MTLTQIKPAGLRKPVALADNEKIRLGTGNDLQIYHDDGKSYIKNTTLGSIFINSVSHTYIANSDNSEYYAKFHGNGSAQLFFDNSKKFETTSAGVSVEGQVRLTDDNSLIVRPTSSAIAFNTGGSERLRINSSGHVKLPDTKELQLGGPLNSGNGDLRIYHDGTHSYITNNTGTLYNFANTWIINNYDNSENFIRAFNNGAVELYYDGVKTFSTKSGGNTLTGTDSSGNVSLGRFYYKQESGTVKALYDPYGGKFQLYDSVHGTFGNSHDLSIYHNGTHSFIENSTGDLYIRDTSGGDIHIQGKSGEESIICHDDGGVELYHDNSKRFETESNGASLTGARLKVQNSGDTDFNLRDTSNNAVSAYIGAKTAGRVEYNCYKEGVGTKYPHVFVGYTEEYARIDTNGIKFNGDTASANALDDYEEGTFTPSIILGATSISYSIQRGSYTKIGDMVEFQIDLYMSGTADGNYIRISGLPFTSANQNPNAFGGAFLNYSQGAFGSIGDRTVFHIVSGNTYMQIYNAVTGNVVSGTSDGVALFSSKEICLTGIYKAA